MRLVAMNPQTLKWVNKFGSTSKKKPNKIYPLYSIADKDMFLGDRNQVRRRLVCLPHTRYLIRL